jgi:hypothetical protein
MTRCAQDSGGSAFFAAILARSQSVLKNADDPVQGGLDQPYFGADLFEATPVQRPQPLRSFAEILNGCRKIANFASGSGLQPSRFGNLHLAAAVRAIDDVSGTLAVYGQTLAALRTQEHDVRRLDRIRSCFRFLCHVRLDDKAI